MTCAGQILWPGRLRLGRRLARLGADDLSRWRETGEHAEDALMDVILLRSGRRGLDRFRDDPLEVLELADVEQACSRRLGDAGPSESGWCGGTSSESSDLTGRDTLGGRLLGGHVRHGVGRPSAVVAVRLVSADVGETIG
jgi:hypothetical protein